jgi:hypothetical protein
VQRKALQALQAVQELLGMALGVAPRAMMKVLRQPTLRRWRGPVPSLVPRLR